jgi:transketolase
MPNVLTLRPADANEVSGAYMVALEHRNTPSVIALSRQGCPNIAKSSPEAVRQGAYVVHTQNCGDDGKGAAQLIIAGTGSEVSLCITACEKLAEVAIKVVSFPCWELFEKQSEAYKHSIFPPGVPVLAVEALSVEGWSRYAHSCVGMSTFGASAPGKDLATRFGFTNDNVAARARELLAFYKGKAVPHLLTIGPPLPTVTPHSGHGKYAAK